MNQVGCGARQPMRKKKNGLLGSWEEMQTSEKAASPVHWTSFVNSAHGSWGITALQYDLKFQNPFEKCQSPLRHPQRVPQACIQQSEQEVMQVLHFLEMLQD